MSSTAPAGRPGSSARYWSRFGEGRYAEAFEVIKDGAAIAPRRGP
jgi:hypothetical protein